MDKTMDVEFYCDVCDESINLRQYEDTKQAYARHIQTGYHLEIAQRFRSIKLGKDDASFPSVISSSGDFPENKKFVSTNFITSFSLFYCRLCRINVNDSAAMTKHLKGEKHLKLESFVKEVSCQRELLELMGFSRKQTFPAESNEVLSYFTNMNAKGRRVCLVCYSTVFADGDYLLDHLRDDENHVIKYNSIFMNWGEGRSFYCMICNVKDGKGADEHCVSDTHRHAMDLLFKFARHGMF